MSNQYLKPTIATIAVVISTICNGQVKQQRLQNFSNPFNSKGKEAATTIITPDRNNRNTDSPQKKLKIETFKGSFNYDLKKEKIDQIALSQTLNSRMGLNDKHTFRQIGEKIDGLGFTNVNYQQLYNGIPVDGCVIMAHYKNGIATSINGQIAECTAIETQYELTKESAKKIAKEHLKVANLLNDYPVELCIVEIPIEKGFDYRLAYKVRIESFDPFIMFNVYVDAITGKIINKVSLIANGDTPGTANTLYSGIQTITNDSYGGGFRLKDNARKIETYDATNATHLNAAEGFVGSVVYSNSSTTWGPTPILTSFSISNTSQDWWFTSISDETPDLYIIVKDGSDQVVYDGRNSYINNTLPPVSFPLYIYLSNPPYSVEVLDYDAVGGDDSGGSYTISTVSGTQSWAGAGNNGQYVILGTSNNPALDVHWGMEVTYDFYLNAFGRNSYDGNGSIIKNYVNPPFPNGTAGWPNNAFALQPPYNIMAYGMGDAITNNPLVAIDIEGHEFTHMVINTNGNGGLAYQRESGALNESFADIFGACVEFYSGVNPDWFIGEGIMIGKPFMRSMSNPNAMQQPDTYGGQYWENPDCGTPTTENDKCGVHTNSGVQNFWFYLLCQGGTGTNDLGNAYNVTGIGISQARQIAYRNLMTYLGPNATYYDAYLGSLQAAQDLYGNPSAQYNAVRAAWFATGIGNNPNNYCSGTTNLTASGVTFSDGSGSADYNNNSNCKWVIAPAGANQISLNFTSFSTEAGFDTVFVYDGPTEDSSVLMTWWGNTLPPTINSTGGALCVKFKSDSDITAAGWTATYTSTGITPSCNGETLLAAPTGTFTDGSGTTNYGNNQLCYWLIAPPCATSVTLSITQLNTELNYDGLIVYNGNSTKAAVLGAFSGTTIPSSVTSTGGEMLVAFVSDFATTLQGFSANYTSAGSAYCSGITTLNTSDYGNIADGSEGSSYCNNMDCRWLIQPPQATSVTLKFTAFDLEPASTDGQTIFDAVEIYNGITTSAPLLGRFSGNSLPPSITANSGSMLVRFFSDMSVTKQGWAAYYTSTNPTYCNATATLTTSTGSFKDGSAANLYANNTTCSWRIQPPGASTITLSFSDFDTELNYDGVIVYNGPDETSPVLGQFTGTNVPAPVTSTGSSMFIKFLSDEALRGNGWTANYTSTIITAINDPLIKEKLKIFPIPTGGSFTIKSDFNTPVHLQIIDISGKQVLKIFKLNKGINLIDASRLSKGIYVLKFIIDNKEYTEKLIIN